MEHTKGKWEARECEAFPADKPRIDIWSESENENKAESGTVVCGDFEASFDKATAQANARRICQCCNAHDGLLDKLEKIQKAADRWPRCCTQWQDSLGGRHCTKCSQKTFAMLLSVQQILAEAEKET